MLNPWVILGLLFVWGASLLGVGKWQRIEGARATLVEAQAKDNAELTAANVAIRTLNDAARKREHEHAAKVAELGETHAQEAERIRTQGRRDVAAARDGALRLRVNVPACGAGAGGVPDAGAAATAVARATEVELSGATSADLLQLVADADEVASDFNLCRGIAMSDRGLDPTTVKGTP